jgi:hypothetical protein
VPHAYQHAYQADMPRQKSNPGSQHRKVSQSTSRQLDASGTT